MNTNEDGGPTDFSLIPPTFQASLDETSPGVVCINCTAKGYPNLQYRWYYNVFGDDWKNMSSNPCLGFYNDEPEVHVQRECTAIAQI